MVTELIDWQVRALASATLELQTAGLDPRPQLMVHLVPDAAEPGSTAARIHGAIGSAYAPHPITPQLPLGGLLRLPRAPQTPEPPRTDARAFAL